MAQNKSKKVKAQNNDEYTLVYSTDPKPLQHCKGCLRPVSECKCGPQSLIDKKKINPVVAFEKKGRGGKSVTLVSKLPKHETFLKELLKFLKSGMGTGGTSYVKNDEGIIEIQGERVDKVREMIEKFKSK